MNLECMLAAKACHEHKQSYVLIVNSHHDCLLLMAMFGINILCVLAWIKAR